ncbi:PREDICTED: caveolin-2-like [Poecilia mexicana]|uniref:Caveolin n=1 Tax=Poecilia mexicana TaxID=48701 RepID=A0A3B3WK75_9TELE|nr:PREDICTED: caveolin-2-like [Poecilia mexicana]
MDTLKKDEDSEVVEIDLGDSSDLEESEDGEEPQTLWRAQPSLDEEENIHTSTLVEISDTKPLITSRDARGINDCLKVGFEDVIAEPPSVRSGDRVWIWSNALFEVSRVWIYRIVTALLALPMSAISGLLFGLLSCFHVWMVRPCIRCVLIGNRWIQSFWDVMLHIVVVPFLTSAGKCCGGLGIHLAKE